MKKMKNIISFLIVIVMFFAFITVPVSAESLTEVPEGYIGIYTKDDLYDVRLNMTGKYIMMNDIVFDDADYAEGGDFYNVGKGWEPIGTSSTPFKGTFDGNGYDIVNLQINNPTGNYQGLFGCISDAAITKTTIVNSNIIGKNHVGGIVGYAYGSKIDNCSNTSSIKGSADVGGIVGRGYYANIKKCINTGNIIGTEYVGGIEGQEAGSNSSHCVVINCMNTGMIQGTNYVCGIAGLTYAIEHCYSIGTINYEQGAKFSPNGYSSYHSYNYYLDTSVENYSGNVANAKSPDQLRRQGTFERWDFDTVWEMCDREYYKYPVPQGVKLVFQLEGSVAIEGTPVYGETLKADVSDITPSFATYNIQWLVDGNVVGTEKTYTVKSEDIGKSIIVKVYSEGDISGSIISEASTVTKAEQTNTPVSATLAGKSDTSFSVNVIAGQEYSIDNENWNTTGEFTSLALNKEYTVYTRMAETDTHFAGEAVDSSLTVTTNKSIIAGEVSIVGDAQYSKDLSADVSLVVPEGVTYKYEWRCGEKVLGTEAEYTLSSSDIDSKIYLALVADGDYTGEIKSSEIEVKAFNIANVTADAVADVQYTTKEITPEVTLFNGSALLEKDVDYTLSYEKNITAGKAQITVTGIGDYTGTKTVEFNIIPRNLSGVTFVAVTPQKYTGYEITPAVTLKFGNYTLVENVDYTVSYSNNTSVGTAEILIEGKGNFASQITKSFAIIKTSLSSAEIIFFETEFKYNGEEITPEIFVMLGSENLTVNKDYTVSYKNNILEGTATVTITGIGGYSGSASAEFEIIGHLYGDWIERTAATCIEKGLDYRVCPGCNGEDTREVDKLGHDFSDEWTVDTEETCAEEGSKSHHCLRCSEISDVTVIPATGNHDYASAITTPATCKQAGVRTYTCTVCSDTYTEPVEIDSTNHVGGTEIRGAYAEDCGNNGYTGDTYCLGCDTKLADGTSIPATGNHDYISVITPPATCNQAGVRTYTCTVCGDTYVEETPALGHTEEVISGKSATCTETGLTKGKRCTVCNEILIAQEEIPALGHTEEVLSGKSATCTETGLTEGKKCSVCGEILVAQSEISALGHKEEVISGKSATCTESGLTEGKKCSVCGEILVAQEEIPALGHKEEIIAGKSASCTETGLTEGKKCSVCNEILVAQAEIPALGHTEEVISGKSATCTETGLTEGKKCSVCGEILVAQSEIPALGHKEEVIPAKSSTCTEAGLTEGKKCSSCGEILVAQKEIAAKGHTPGSWEVSKKAEIGKEGKEVKKCTVCKAVVDERAIPALKEEGKPGDVDGNGKITAADARLALRISAKLEKATEYQTRIADMDKNGKITAADARKILRISAKLE